nr:hypothetical protein Iba_chr14aCG24210 [Ipomoea batatas]
MANVWNIVEFAFPFVPFAICRTRIQFSIHPALPNLSRVQICKYRQNLQLHNIATASLDYILPTRLSVSCFQAEDFWPDLINSEIPKQNLGQKDI